MEVPQVSNSLIEESHSVSIQELGKYLRELGELTRELNEKTNASMKEYFQESNREMKQYFQVLGNMLLERERNVTGWQKNFEDHLELVFTNVALDYLRVKFPLNEFINIFKLEPSPPKRWNYPPRYDFELDGLIYDRTDNILYMVESKFRLSPREVGKVETTQSYLMDYIKSERMPASSGDIAKRFNRIWNLFFNCGEDTIIVDKMNTQVYCFLGFNSAESQEVVLEAKSKFFKLIGPNDGLYCVYE